MAALVQISTIYIPSGAGSNNGRSRNRCGPLRAPLWFNPKNNSWAWCECVGHTYWWLESYAVPNASRQSRRKAQLVENFMLLCPALSGLARIHYLRRLFGSRFLLRGNRSTSAAPALSYCASLALRSTPGGGFYHSEHSRQLGGQTAINVLT